MPVTNENVRILQFLDLIKDVDVYSEEEGNSLKKRTLEIMKKLDITFSALEPYLSFYPEKIMLKSQRNRGYGSPGK